METLTLQDRITIAIFYLCVQQRGWCTEEVTMREWAVYRHKKKNPTTCYIENNSSHFSDLFLPLESLIHADSKYHVGHHS